MAWGQREQTKGKTATYTNRPAQDDMVQHGTAARETHLVRDPGRFFCFSCGSREEKDHLFTQKIKQTLNVLTTSCLPAFLLYLVIMK